MNEKVSEHLCVAIGSFKTVERSLMRSPVGRVHHTTPQSTHFSWHSTADWSSIFGAGCTSLVPVAHVLFAIHLGSH